MSIVSATKIATLVLALSWLPLIVVGGLGISDNPIGLGLLAMGRHGARHAVAARVRDLPGADYRSKQAAARLTILSEEQAPLRLSRLMAAFASAM